jgi:spore germination protein YaaH
MNRLLILVLLLFTVNTAIAQNDYSVHKEHREQFGKSLSVEKSASAEDDGSGIIPLQPNETKELSAAVFGYLPDWEYLDGMHQYFRYDLLSHIAAFDFPVSPDGSIRNPAGWPWTDLINEAHQNGVKVILTAVNFDEDDIRTIITNQTVKDVFFANVKSKIETYQLDGVNIDFEGLYNEDKGTAIVWFMEELTDYIHTELPGKEVSFAGPAVNWNDFWWLEGLVYSCDYVFIMGYAFAGSWSTTTWANAPLTGGVKNITTTITNDYFVPISLYPEKVILGLPYYGHKWITNSGSAHASIESSIGSTRFRNDEPASQVHGLLWDLTTHTPWFREDIGGGQWNQTWFDNDSSLGLKYDLAISRNLKGVGMWALGYDGARQELWNLIDRKFGSGEIPAPAKPQSFRVVAEAQAGLTLKFEVPNYATGFKAFMSTDGLNFEMFEDVSVNSISIDSLSVDSVYYFKVRAYNDAGESEFTEVLAGIPAMTVQKNLIVNGFDRVTSTNNTFDYITRYGPPMLEIDKPFHSTSNEAVFRDLINLENYDVVIWMLGDESTADETFNSLEQDKVKEFLNDGGKLFVSGAEIGWDLVERGGEADKQFYADYLRAEYISDAPNGQSGTYYTATPIVNSIFDGVGDITFDDGTHGTFDVDWPDAIEALTGSDNILDYKDLPANTDGYAGISYTGLFPEGEEEGQIVYLAFPYETIYPEQSRIDVINKVYEYFDLSSPVNNQIAGVPEKFELYQNYPNPFNPTTRIQYYLPEVLALSSVEGLNNNRVGSYDVNLIVYNILGEEVSILVNQEQSSGKYSVTFNAAGLASGMYIYQLHARSSNGRDYFMRKKMVLVK